MSDFILRAAGLGDAGHCVGIYSYDVKNTAITYEYDVPSAEEFRGRMADTLAKYPFIVAEKDGKILGYAFCIHKQFINDNNMTDVKTLYIDDLCVDENARGRHIGKTLYDFVVSYAKENGYYNVTLNVWADNKKAVGFYEKIGLRVQKIGMEKIL